MLTGDIAALDADGYLKITGRVADFNIRGGRNVGGPEVEQAVAKHKLREDIRQRIESKEVPVALEH